MLVRLSLGLSTVLLCATASAQGGACDLPRAFAVHIAGSHPAGAVRCELRVVGDAVRSACEVTEAHGESSDTIVWRNVSRSCRLDAGGAIVTLNGIGYVLGVRGGAVQALRAPLSTKNPPSFVPQRSSWERLPDDAPLAPSAPPPVAPSKYPPPPVAPSKYPPPPVATVPPPAPPVAARVAQQPDDAPLEGTLYDGPMPLCGEFIWHAEPQYTLHCEHGCTGFKNSYNGGFINIDYEMAYIGGAVSSILIRVDNGRKYPVRVCYTATSNGKGGSFTAGRPGFPQVIDANARSASEADGAVHVPYAKNNSPADVTLQINDLQIFEKQPRGWVRLR